jgi:ketosteroid isomerase-like protein
MYRSRYGAGGAATMGTLSFANLELRQIDPANALVIGSFALKRKAENGGDASGYFSLLFRKDVQGWRIVVDHTP